MKKLKRLVCALLAVLTVFSILPTAAFASTRRPMIDDSWMDAFTDIPIGAYYESAVQWAKDLKITSGTTETTFSPQNYVSRCQMLMFIWVLAGSDRSYGNYAAPFTDVSDDAYYRDAVGWAVHRKITSGTSETTFSPDNAITWEQAITFVYKAFSESNSVQPTEAGKLASYSCASYAEPAYKWANNHQYLAGIPEFAEHSEFVGGDFVTRGMAIYLLWEMTTGEYLTSRIEKMVSWAENQKNKTWYDFNNEYKNYVTWKATDWCELFVGLCAWKYNMTGFRASGCPIPESNPYLGEAGETIWRLLGRNNMYMPSEILNDSEWYNWRTRVSMSDLDFKLDKAIEIDSRFMPRRGDIFFVQKGGYNTILSDCWCGHVGIVTDAKPVNGKVKIYTIEGNTSGDEYASEYWKTSKVDTGVYVVDPATGKIDGMNWTIFGFGRIS